MVGLSIVIPVLNEASEITDALAALRPLQARGVDVIVVDGGSHDGTFELARATADQVLTAPRGRGAQMNAGAQAARGDTLVFLHADTRLPDEADRIIARHLATSGKAWGRFDVGIISRSRVLRLVSRMMNVRSRLTGICTGDQALFMTRAAFDQAGGFPDIPLMEDIAMSARLKRIGSPLRIREKVATSGRRWENRGVFRTIILMWRLRWSFFLGTDPAELAKRYGYVPRQG